MPSGHKGLTPEIVAEALTEAGSQRGAARLLGVNLSAVQHHLKRDAEHEPSTSPQDEFVEIPVFHRDYSHHDKHYVYPLGDVHIGDQAHAADRWQEWLDFLVEQRRPNSSMLGTGDFLNAALKDSKSEAYDETHTVRGARKLLTQQLRPLASKDLIDGLMPGNHEARIYRAVGDCPIDVVCETLGVQYIEAAAVIIYTVGDQQYEVFLRHGTGNGGGLIGSRANQLSRQANVVLADIYVSGHVHNQLVSRDRLLVREGDRMVTRRRLFVGSGSFQQYARYASERGYVAGEIGAPPVFDSTEGSTMSTAASDLKAGDHIRYQTPRGKPTEAWIVGFDGPQFAPIQITHREGGPQGGLLKPEEILEHVGPDPRTEREEQLDEAVRLEDKAIAYKAQAAELIDEARDADALTAANRLRVAASRMRDVHYYTVAAKAHRARARRLGPLYRVPSRSSSPR